MESQVFGALALALLGGLSNSIGALFVIINQAQNLKMLGLLQGFAAGLMLSISFFYLVHNAIDSIGFLKGNLWFFAGATFFAFVASFIPELSDDKKNDGDEGSKDINKKHRRQVLFSRIITALGISLHNFLEGMAVFLASIKGFRAGLNLALAIALHHIPEGIAVALPVYFATQSKWQAFKLATLSGLADPLGVIIVAYLFPGSLSPEILEALLGSACTPCLWPIHAPCQHRLVHTPCPPSHIACLHFVCLHASSAGIRLLASLSSIFLRAFFAGERVMNALFIQELRQKRKEGESSSIVTAPTGDSSARTRPRASPTPTIKAGGNPEDQLQDETSSSLHKRKAVVEAGTLQGEHIPIIQVEEHAEGGEDVEEDSPSRPRIYEDYTSQIALLGKDPSPMASRIAYDLTSEIDANYINSLDLTDILQRTCNSAIESLIYAGASVRRHQVMLMKAHKEKKEGHTTFMRLEQELSQVKEEHARALSEITHETDMALSRKDAELQAGKELLLEMKKKLDVAHRNLGETQAQAAKDKESFKEEYLKSANFQVDCCKKSFSYLEMGFQGAMDQCRAKGYAPEGASTDFLSFEDFLTSLPSDE